MKKILFAALALLAASCNNPETDTQSLETSPTTLDFEATGSTPQTVQVKAQNVAWEHAVSADAKALRRTETRYRSAYPITTWAKSGSDRSGYAPPTAASSPHAASPSHSRPTPRRPNYPCR